MGTLLDGKPIAQGVQHEAQRGIGKGGIQPSPGVSQFL